MFEGVVHKLYNLFSSPQPDDMETDYIYDEYEEEDNEELENNMDDRYEEPPKARNRQSRNNQDENSKIVVDKRGFSAVNKLDIVLEYPKTVEDARAVCDNLKNNMPVVIAMEDIDRVEAQRILDFVGGAVYSLEGDIQRISSLIYILVPPNINVQNHIEELKSKSGGISWRQNNRQD